MIILYFHLQPQFKNELFHILHIKIEIIRHCININEKIFSLFIAEIEDITWPREDTKFLFEC